MKAWKILVIWVLALSVLYSTLSIVRHNHFQSGAFDAGIYDQAVWQYSRFLWPYNTVKDRFILGDHLTFTLPLLAPLFWIWNDIRILLIAQSVFVCFSVLVVYKLTRLRNFSPFAALGISFIYSLFYGIQYGIYFDFHPVLFGMALIPWMLYFLEAKRIKLFFITLVLLLFTQENMGLALASLGCVYVFRKKYHITGIVLVICGILASLIAMKAITIFSPVGFEYMPQITLDMKTNITRLFDAQEKRQVWLYTLSSYAFLPVFSPGAMMAVTFDLAQYFVTGNRFQPMWTPFKHHRAILAPFVLLGALEVLEFLKKKKVNVNRIVMGLVIITIVEQFVFHYPLNKLVKVSFWAQESWMQDNELMMKFVPVGASLATQQSLVPHLAHRKKIYLVWPRQHDFPQMPCGKITCWWLDFGGKPDYLLIDSHPTVWLTMLLETPDHVNEALTNMEKMGRITLIRQINDIRLFTISYPESRRLPLR